MCTKFKNSVAFLIQTPVDMLKRSPEEIRAWREQEEKETKRKWKKKTSLPVYLVFLTIPFCSCVTRKACERKFPNVEIDSVRIVRETVTTIRDTTIYITLKGDTVFKSIPVGHGVSKLVTPFATSYASVRDGRLIHRLEQKDTLFASNVKNAVRTSISSMYQDRLKTLISKVRKPSSWQWFQICIGRVLLLIVGILILRRFNGNSNKT